MTSPTSAPRSRLTSAMLDREHHLRCRLSHHLMVTPRPGSSSTTSSRPTSDLQIETPEVAAVGKSSSAAVGKPQINDRKLDDAAAVRKLTVVPKSPTPNRNWPPQSDVDDDNHGTTVRVGSPARDSAKLRRTTLRRLTPLGRRHRNSRLSLHIFAIRCDACRFEHAEPHSN